MIYFNPNNSKFIYCFSSSTSDLNKYQVHHDKIKQMFVIQLDPNDQTKIANLMYQFEDTKTAETKLVNLLSTNVPKEYGGKGIAKLLALAAFEHCANNNTRMKLSCWYLDGYLQRNPNPRYNQLVYTTS